MHGTSMHYFKEDIKKWIYDNFAKDITILDVGAGCGTYWNLLHDKFRNIDAVEAFEPNITDHNLREKYRIVFFSDIRDLTYNHYNLIIFGDILEHLAVEDAQKVLDYAYDRCDNLVVALPYMYEQDAIYGNTYEIHQQPDLTPENVLERYPRLQLLFNNDQCGYYIKKEN